MTKCYVHIVIDFFKSMRTSHAASTLLARFRRVTLSFIHRIHF